MSEWIKVTPDTKPSDGYMRVDVWAVTYELRDATSPEVTKSGRRFCDVSFMRNPNFRGGLMGDSNPYVWSGVGKEWKVTHYMIPPKEPVE